MINATEMCNYRKVGHISWTMERTNAQLLEQQLQCEFLNTDHIKRHNKDHSIRKGGRQRARRKQGHRQEDNIRQRTWHSLAQKHH